MCENPDFNCKVIQKFGNLIGFHQPQRSYYGGLVEVKFEDGKLFVLEWVPPKDELFLELARRRDLFSIAVSEDDEINFVCLTGFGEPHSCRIKVETDSHFAFKCHSCRIGLETDSQFAFKCLQPENHKHPEDLETEFLEWHMFRRTEPPNTMLDWELSLSREHFDKTKEFTKCCVYKKLEIGSTPNFKNNIIKPGLFKCAYSKHGVEFINLVMHDTEIKGVKISGDSNVPANKITFKVDPRKSLVLDEATQATATCNDLASLPDNLSDNYLNEPHEQPFLIPSDCDKFTLDFPSTCKWRFKALAQVAEHGFESPRFIPSQWIVFNDDLYAVIFLELKCIFLYKRVAEIAA